MSKSSKIEMSSLRLGAMKWTMAMTSKKLARKTEVERALDHRITQKEAAERLGISERQF